MKTRKLVFSLLTVGWSHYWFWEGQTLRLGPNQRLGSPTATSRAATDLTSVDLLANSIPWQAASSLWMGREVLAEQHSSTRLVTAAY